MQVHNGLPPTGTLPKVALTMGMFDGVHIGHRYLINALQSEAHTRGLPTGLLTYDPHPRIVLNKEPEQLRLLTTLPEKLHILSALGLDHVFVLPFNKEVSALSPGDFMQTVLKDRLNTSLVIVGEDHRFAAKRVGDVAFLQDFGKSLMIEAIGLPKLEERNHAVSSSLVRDFISRGDIQQANQMLGSPYPIAGEVVPGDRIGRTLGYPTANLHPAPWKLYPAEGVYYGQTILHNSRFYCLISMGSRPTLQRPEHRIEAYLMDYQGPEFYGTQLTLEVLGHLRPQIKFESLPALVHQMQQDERRARELLGMAKKDNQSPN
jgi:riboflavin kinase / FMN adenylyltransferase